MTRKYFTSGFGNGFAPLFFIWFVLPPFFKAFSSFILFAGGILGNAVTILAFIRRGVATLSRWRQYALPAAENRFSPEEHKDGSARAHLNPQISDSKRCRMCYSDPSFMPQRVGRSFDLSEGLGLRPNSFPELTDSVNGFDSKLYFAKETIPN